MPKTFCEVPQETWCACQRNCKTQQHLCVSKRGGCRYRGMLAHLAQSLGEKPCQTERIFLRLERALCQHQALSVVPPVQVSQWIALAALDKTLLYFLQDIPSAGFEVLWTYGYCICTRRQVHITCAESHIFTRLEVRWLHK